LDKAAATKGALQTQKQEKIYQNKCMNCYFYFIRSKVNLIEVPRSLFSVLFLQNCKESGEAFRLYGFGGVSKKGSRTKTRPIGHSIFTNVSV